VEVKAGASRKTLVSHVYELISHRVQWIKRRDEIGKGEEDEVKEKWKGEKERAVEEKRGNEKKFEREKTTFIT
jgi:hypothetical protein